MTVFADSVVIAYADCAAAAVAVNRMAAAAADVHLVANVDLNALIQFAVYAHVVMVAVVVFLAGNVMVVVVVVVVVALDESNDVGVSEWLWFRPCFSDHLARGRVVRRGTDEDQEENFPRRRQRRTWQWGWQRRRIRK